MKRSHVVQYMTQVYHESHRGGNSEMSDKERMSYVLEHLESIGMLPPAYDIFQGRENTFNDKMMSNQWEPEDV